MAMEFKGPTEAFAEQMNFLASTGGSYTVASAPANAVRFDYHALTGGAQGGQANH